jgi:hypothetical protein
MGEEFKALFMAHVRQDIGLRAGGVLGGLLAIFVFSPPSGLRHGFDRQAGPALATAFNWKAISQQANRENPRFAIFLIFFLAAGGFCDFITHE